MEYHVVQGHRLGSQLIYIPKEKFLYLKKNERSGKRTFICYQSVLSVRQRDGEDHTKCTACVIIGKNDECWRNRIHHSVHQNHRRIFDDLRSLNNMKSTCQFLRDNLTISAEKISAKEIYSTEMAK